MVIETQRLTLHPLTTEQLEQAKKSPVPVARAFGASCAHVGFWESIAKRRIYTAKQEVIAVYPNAFLLSTTWFLVDKESMRVVGEAGFKGPPDRDDAVEIGYSMREYDRNRGYMTEAVGALVRFAFSQTKLYVKSVTAFTLPENIASHRVLMKNGFVRQPWRGKYWMWRRERTAAEE